MGTISRAAPRPAERPRRIRTWHLAPWLATPSNSRSYHFLPRAICGALPSFGSQSNAPLPGRAWGRRLASGHPVRCQHHLHDATLHPRPPPQAPAAPPPHGRTVWPRCGNTRMRRETRRLRWPYGSLPQNRRPPSPRSPLRTGVDPSLPRSVGPDGPRRGVRWQTGADLTSSSTAPPPGPSFVRRRHHGGAAYAGRPPLLVGCRHRRRRAHHGAPPQARALSGAATTWPTPAHCPGLWDWGAMAFGMPQLSPAAPLVGDPELRPATGPGEHLAR